MRVEEKVYTDGKDYFSNLFQSLENAKSEILIESYIYQRGELSKKLLLILKDASSRNVQIKIIVDAAGSYGETKELFEFCVANKIEAKLYHPILWTDLINTFKFLNRRNHRKTIIVDRRIAYTGSLNISDVHVLEKTAWKDYGVSIVGEGVQELCVAFDKIFQKKRLNKIIQNVIFKRETNTPSSGVYLNDTSLKRKECYLNLLNNIQKSKKRLWIANAYILPEFKIQKHLEKAAARGVDVRILSSSHRSDIFFMPWITTLVYKRSLHFGIKIYEYLPSFFHGKVFVFDDYISIGSSNLNHRSLLHDLEVDVVLSKNENKALLELDLERCFSLSQALTKSDIQRIPSWQGVIAKIFYLFKYWF